MTLVRVCRRHRTACGTRGDVVWCPRGHEVDEGKWDVQRARDGHVAIPGGNGVKTIATKKFQDAGGNVLYLRITTSKRTPYVLRVQHAGANGKGGSRTGVLATAGDEATAESKLDQLADDAAKRGWKEVLGRPDGLKEIPEPSAKPMSADAQRVRGGGFQSAYGALAEAA